MIDDQQPLLSNSIPSISFSSTSTSFRSRSVAASSSSSFTRNRKEATSCPAVEGRRQAGAYNHRNVLNYENQNESTPLFLADHNQNPYNYCHSEVRNSSIRSNHIGRGGGGSTRNVKYSNHHQGHSNANSNINNNHHRSSPIYHHLTCHGCCCIQCVRTNEIAIISKFGKFDNIRHHGLLCLPFWPFVRVEQRLSLRVQQLDVVCETKTKDNGMSIQSIFVGVSISSLIFL